MMEQKNNHIAAIDVGTNSFHLIVVKVKDDGNFEIVDREKEVIRLGEGSAGSIKQIKPEAMSRAILTLKRFKGIADSYNANLRAVATSAVRESYNKNKFMQKVFDETGIELEVISGFEEARLIYLGALRAVPIFNKKSLIIDIGGGSTEFLIGLNGVTIFSVSIKIGAVRLTEKFFPDYEVTASRIKECRRWVEGEIFQVVHSIKKTGFSVCVGSSGTIMSAGLMIQEVRNRKSLPTSILNNYEFSREELHKIEDEILSRKSLDRRKKIPGLDEKRADIIPAGIIILSTIFDLLELETMTISGYALREGIILDTLQKHHADLSLPNLSDIRNESIQQLARSCNYDRIHCTHVAKLSLQLFDQLKDLHGLDNEYREFLYASAILHDIGYHISHSNHHQHSYYIIRYSELLGFNENEINIIAHVARYHRKSLPKARHEDFGELPERTQNVIKKLAAILRVADGLDRTHKRIVQNVECRMKNGAVGLHLKIKEGANPEIELWNLERRKELFEEVYQKKIKAICTA